MAKKKAAAAKKPAPQKTPQKKQKKSPPPPVDQADEITLDPVEEKAFDLAQSSDAVRGQLELAVTLGATKAVRKVFKDRGIDLTMEQAGTLALVLFGD